MVAPTSDPRPAESNFKTSGLHSLATVPTGTGKLKAYVRGTFTSVTFGYVEAADPTVFHAFTSLTPTTGAAEVFLEPGPGVQVYVSIVSASGDGVFIGLSGGY